MRHSRFLLRRSTPFSDEDLARIQRGWRTFQHTVLETIARMPELLHETRYHFGVPVLCPDGKSLELSLGGSRGHAAVKLFEDAFPEAVLAELPLSTRLDLELGHGFGEGDPKWRPFFSTAERAAIARAPALWPGRALDSLELRFMITNNRPALKFATPDAEWATCPYCGRRFKIQDINAFRASRHLRCGQALVNQSHARPDR